MKRLHRVVVELTFDRPVAEKHAARMIDEILGGMDREQVMQQMNVRHGASWTHFTVKQGSRVIAAEIVKARK